MVFLLSAKAALATRKNISRSFTSTAGFSRTGSTTKALSTFGGGVNISAGTFTASRGSQRNWQRIDSGPQAFSPGCARILSATSCCTISASRLTGSSPFSSSLISGVVM